jgi:hypothetical protein
MTSTNNILTQTYSTFKFNSEIYNKLEPYIQHLITFLVRHKIKTITLDDCFQTSMTLFQIKLDLETIKQITYYTYHLTQINSKILNP